VSCSFTCTRTRDGSRASRNSAKTPGGDRSDASWGAAGTHRCGRSGGWGRTRWVQSRSSGHRREASTVVGDYAVRLARPTGPSTRSYGDQGGGFSDPFSTYGTLPENGAPWLWGRSFAVHSRRRCCRTAASRRSSYESKYSCDLSRRWTSPLGAPPLDANGRMAGRTAIPIAFSRAALTPGACRPTARGQWASEFRGRRTAWGQRYVQGRRHDACAASRAATTSRRRKILLP
jgi:hypothetical protein